MRAPRILLLGLCAALSACAAKKPPPPQTVTLGQNKLQYRDYTRVKGSLCGVDPRLLGPEFQKINEVLEQFVSKTAGASKPEATAEEVSMLREGAKSLGPVVDAHSKNLAGLNGCGFKTKPPFPELMKKGNEIVPQAKARLAEAPAVVAAAEKRLAQEKWREESAAREATAKQTWCGGKVTVGSGDVYFARQEPDGKMRWLFCDGVTVEWMSGSEPAVIVPDTISKKDRKKIQDKRYLESVKGYPAEEIDKFGAPKKPEAKQ
jgi:hypothetical protein